MYILMCVFSTVKAIVFSYIPQKSYLKNAYIHLIRNAYWLQRTDKRKSATLSVCLSSSIDNIIINFVTLFDDALPDGSLPAKFIYWKVMELLRMLAHLISSPPHILFG